MTMQLYIINWSFQSAEDQLFATQEFCEYFQNGKLNEFIEGFELKFIAHTPQDGTGIIICKAENASIAFNLLNIWRENYDISFNIKPALTSEELVDLKKSTDE
tara:strand:+ start:111 stop:419 length:309 start_codon:yes stop_codon:yes gene_type:complete